MLSANFNWCFFAAIVALCFGCKAKTVLLQTDEPFLERDVFGNFDECKESKSDVKIYKFKKKDNIVFKIALIDNDKNGSCTDFNEDFISVNFSEIPCFDVSYTSYSKVAKLKPKQTLLVKDEFYTISIGANGELSIIESPKQEKPDLNLSTYFNLNYPVNIAGKTITVEEIIEQNLSDKDSIFLFFWTAKHGTSYFTLCNELAEQNIGIISIFNPFIGDINEENMANLPFSGIKARLTNTSLYIPFSTPMGILLDNKGKIIKEKALFKPW